MNLGDIALTAMVALVLDELLVGGVHHLFPTFQLPSFHDRAWLVILNTRVTLKVAW